MQNINDQKIYFQANQIHQVQKDQEYKGLSPIKFHYKKSNEIVYLSQKRLIQSLKKMPIRKGSLFENTKMKRLQLNFHSISNSKDTKKNDNDHIKMPDLLKIKLKKQLETIQKSDKHYQNKQKSKQSQKSYFKVNKVKNMFFQSFYQANQNSKKYEIIKASLKNAKKIQGLTGRKKNHNNSKVKDEEKHINFHEKRKVTKYYNLLEYANKEIRIKSSQKRDIHYVNRVKTQASGNSRLFNKGNDSLELSGIQIMEDSSLHNHKVKLATLFQQTINAKQIQDAYLSRKRKQSQEKNFRTKTRLVKSQSRKQSSVKNHEISPWVSKFQQLQMSNNIHSIQL